MHKNYNDNNNSRLLYCSFYKNHALMHFIGAPEIASKVPQELKILSLVYENHDILS